MKRVCLVLLILGFFAGIGLKQPAGTAAQEEVPGAETLRLNSGWEMPVTGINFSPLTPVQTENAVYWALREGFRLIDLSGSTGNEEAAGRAIRRAVEEKLVTREEIFVAAGIRMEAAENTEVSPEAADAAILNILEQLGLEYLDLFLLRQNRYDLDLAAWQAMERAAETGLLRSIGLSGFTDIRNYDLFVENAASVRPAVLQIPMHPYQQRKDMKEHLAPDGTVLMTESPLGGEHEEQVLFADPAISGNATWHHKTSEQILLRWQFQSGNIALPSAYDEAQIAEYHDIYDFELSEEEMGQIDALDRDGLQIWY